MQMDSDRDGRDESGWLDRSGELVATSANGRDIHIFHRNNIQAE